MLQFKWKILKGRSYNKVTNFLRAPAKAVTEAVEPFIERQLNKDVDKLKKMLLEGRLKLAALSPQTVAHKASLSNRVANPSIPLVRFGQIADNIFVSKTKAKGSFIVYVSNTEYHHYDEPERASGRTVAGIALIHQMGDLGHGVYIVRDIFKDLAELLKNNLRYATEAGLRALTRGMQ